MGRPGSKKFPAGPKRSGRPGGFRGRPGSRPAGPRDDRPPREGSGPRDAGGAPGGAGFEAKRPFKPKRFHFNGPGKAASVYRGKNRDSFRERAAAAPAEPTAAVSETGESYERVAPRPGGRFIFGVNPALEALRARPREIERIFYVDGHLNPKIAAELLSRAREARVRTEAVTKERLAGMAEGGVHQGIVLELGEFRYTELSDLIAKRGLIVVLDGLQDPHNVGAIIRSAHALGATGVIMGKDRAASITGAVVKASAGATEHTQIARVVNLSRAIEELKHAGYWIVAADPEGTVLPQAKLDGPLAVVVGAEGEGVRHGVLNHCDFRVKIPMVGKVASLNASVSAGIVLYEIVRQRLSSASVGKS